MSFQSAFFPHSKSWMSFSVLVYSIDWMSVLVLKNFSSTLIGLSPQFSIDALATSACSNNA